MRRSKIVSPMHFVFATRDRLPLITPEIEANLYRLLSAQACEMKAQVLAIGGLEDHVHIAVLFPATVSYADFVKQLKGAASYLLKEVHMKPEEYFYWQKGYGAFGFSRTEIPRIIAYVNEQKERHASKNLWASLEETDEPSPTQTSDKLPSEGRPAKPLSEQF